MHLKHGKLLFKNIDGFRKLCKEYFNSCFKEIMKQDVFSLPYVDKYGADKNSVLNEPFRTIMVTMRDWCNNNNIEGNIKGLVIYGYSLDSHLKQCKYPVNILKDDSYSTLLEEKDQTVIVYNPAKKVILFLKRATKTQNLDYEMKLSTSDLIKFTLIYNAILEKSGIKLINLLVTEKDVEYEWKCEHCKLQVIKMENLSSHNVFEVWWIERESYFGKEFSHINISKSFSSDLCANILGFLAGLQFTKGCNFQCMLPSLTNKKHKQMKEAKLVSPERLRIVHSCQNSLKHLKIKSCYGSVASTVAREMLRQKLLEKDEVLYYVIDDSRSHPVPEIDYIFNRNRKMFSYNSTVKLSEIFNELVMANESKEKIHLLADECDGEKLDETEVTDLNDLLTKEKLKDSTIFLFFQPIEKKRKGDDHERESNMISKLNMKEEVLLYNMVNTIEINDFVAYTVDGLTKQSRDQTATFFPTYSDTAGESTEQLNPTEISSEPATATKDLKNQVKKKKKKRMNGKIQTQSITESQANKGAMFQSDSEKFDVRKNLTLDETFEYSVCAETGANKKIVSAIKHIMPIKCGHNITCEMPSLVEINCSENSAKFKILLIFILKRIITKFCEYRREYDIRRLEDLTNIPKNIKRYVILHFDARNDIPEIFDTAFRLMQIRDLVTTDYEQFKRGKKDKNWIFLICNYRAFRGCEYSRVIVVLHPSMYYLKHYLPECLSRCSTYLRIVVLNAVNYVENRSPHEILKTIIDTWKSPKDGNPLVNIWNINLCSIAEQYFIEELQPADMQQIKIKTDSTLYAELEEKLRQLKKD